jgi:hypothetical protein
MLTDASLQFSLAAPGDVITATAASGNVIDLGPAQGEDLGVAERSLKFAIYTTAAFTTTNAATLTVQVQGAPDNGSGAPGSYLTYVETPSMAAALLTWTAANGGVKIPLDLPHRSLAGLKILPRFLRLNYVVGTGVFSAGSLIAYLVIDRDDWSMGQYKSGYTVGS